MDEEEALELRVGSSRHTPLHRTPLYVARHTGSFKVVQGADHSLVATRTRPLWRCSLAKCTAGTAGGPEQALWQAARPFPSPLCIARRPPASACLPTEAEAEADLEAAATSSAKRSDLQPPCFSSFPTFVPSHRRKSESCMYFFFSSFKCSLLLPSSNLSNLPHPPYLPTSISLRLLFNTSDSILCAIAGISAQQQQPHSFLRSPAAHVRHISRPKGGVKPEFQTCSRTLAHSHLSI